MRNRRQTRAAIPRAPAARARRQLRRGESRKALQTLRLACCDENENPRVWVQYGHHAGLCGKLDEARSALAHAAWLFDRRRQHPRAAVVRGLLDRLAGAARAA
jgi:Flp pilus assembly protein TadD